MPANEGTLAFFIVVGSDVDHGTINVTIKPVACQSLHHGGAVVVDYAPAAVAVAEDVCGLDGGRLRRASGREEDKRLVGNVSERPERDDRGEQAPYQLTRHEHGSGRGQGESAEGARCEGVRDEGQRENREGVVAHRGE